jgi:gliding motility-associated-like protein
MKSKSDKMRPKYFYIILVLFSFSSNNAHSQTNCETPLPPELTLVSVQPENGFTELNWILSPSTDVAAYVLYRNDNGIWMSFDTLWNPSATVYTYTTEFKYFSASFVVAVFRQPIIPGMDGCISPLSNELNTIFAKSSIDTCNKKIAVSWNSYPSSPKKVTGYSILLSVNGGNYNEISKLDSDINTFTLNDFANNAEYCFVVRANIEGGFFSTSNKACLSTKMQRPPNWINADQATVNSDNKISLSFTIDPSSAITHFSLERKTGPSGIFQEIALPVSINGSVTYIDEKADITQINYYRISAINNCNIPVTISNPASNIVLSLERTGDDFNLRWNSYKKWLGKISSYRLFINTGNGFEEKRVIDANDTTITLMYKDIMYEVADSSICFYVSTSESLNPYGVTGQSLSCRVCAAPTEKVTVPNIFTPNSGTTNSRFRPVLSFTPKDYQLIISDRQGSILFDTKEHLAEWDGTRNGNPQPQGVYLWFLKVTTPSGKRISKTGTVTIINK